MLAVKRSAGIAPEDLGNFYYSSAVTIKNQLVEFYLSTQDMGRFLRGHFQIQNLLRVRHPFIVPNYGTYRGNVNTLNCNNLKWRSYTKVRQLFNINS